MGTQRSNFVFRQRSSLFGTLIVFSIKHHLKANSLSSLCWPKTQVSTQNLQTHPPLPMAFLVRHSSLNYREFKTKNWWWRVHSSRHVHSSHLKPIQTTSVSCTRTWSNLFAKKNSDSFLLSANVNYTCSPSLAFLPILYFVFYCCIYIIRCAIKDGTSFFSQENNVFWGKTPEMEI